MLCCRHTVSGWSGLLLSLYFSCLCFSSTTYWVGSTAPPAPAACSEVAPTTCYKSHAVAKPLHICEEQRAHHDQALTLDSGIAGIAVFTYLTAAIYKCNEVIKKEVALKGESSRFMVTVLGSIAVLQALSFLTVLYRQELWLNLILIPRQGSVKGVSVAHP